MHDDTEKKGLEPDTETLLRAEKETKRKRHTRKTIFVSIFILLLLSFGGYTYYFFIHHNRVPWQKVASLSLDISEQYIESPVTESTIQPEISITGYVVPYDAQNVTLRTDGAITSVHFKEGERVKKGDVLATVDNTIQLYQIASLQTQLDTARLKGNKSQETLLEMQIENAQNNLVYTTATANFDGVVASCDWEVGDYNVAGTTTNQMTIVDVSKLKATVQISELDMKYVHVGERALLSFSSLPEVLVTAEVSKIPMLGVYTSSGLGAVNVELTIANPPSGLWSGFTFAGKIDSQAKITYTLIQQGAIRNENGRSFVTKKGSDGSFKDEEVRIRYLGNGKCQLLSGDVIPGDTLLIKKTNPEDAFGGNHA
jgi:multidrug efflux pump subunit AcrA (membrane-fusion protein)